MEFVLKEEKNNVVMRCNEYKKVVIKRLMIPDHTNGQESFFGLML